MEISEASVSSSLPLSPLVEQAQLYAWALYEEHRAPRMVFHSYHYARDMVDTAITLCGEAEAPKEVAEVGTSGCLFAANRLFT